MVRISLLVSKDVVEKLFLPKFCELCSESMFHIRKVCATSIGEMCRIVGPQLAEQYLVSEYRVSVSLALCYFISLWRVI